MLQWRTLSYQIDSVVPFCLLLSCLNRISTCQCFLVHAIMKGYPRCEMLLDVDTPTAVYQPELHDPDVCHADATNLWELSLVGVSCLATKIPWQTPTPFI